MPVLDHTLFVELGCDLDYPRGMSIWVVLLALTACTASVTTESRAYDERFESTVLDIVRSDDTPTANAPAVVYVHGGSWRAGSRGTEAGVIERLARGGYVGINVDYRLVPDGTFPSAVDDVFCALAFVQTHPDELGIDPSRIAVMGYSAGGHLIGMLAAGNDVAELQDDSCPSGRATTPAAAISAAGPMDLPALGTGSVVEDFVGVPFAEDPARWALASPQTHVTGDEPPFLFVHAEHDLIVQIEQSEHMAATLRNAGVSAELLKLEGGGHLLGDGAGAGQEQLEAPFETSESAMAVFDFLERTVGAP